MLGIPPCGHLCSPRKRKMYLDNIDQALAIVQIKVQSWCYSCGNKGHLSKDCLSKEKEKTKGKDNEQDCNSNLSFDTSCNPK
eukprot:c37876_g1_i1 orf=519-764(+)